MTHTEGDTDPTPERRWRWIDDVENDKAFTPLVGLLPPNSPSHHAFFWMHRSAVREADRDQLLATLNEAETLRAERVALQERVRVLEAALTAIQGYGSSVPLGMTEAMFDAAAVRDMKRIAGRALAGAEMPAPLRVCDACGLTSADATWNDCAPGFEDMHLIQGPVPDYCGPVRAGPEAEAGR